MQKKKKNQPVDRSNWFAGQIYMSEASCLIAIEVFRVLHLFPVLSSVRAFIDSHRNKHKLLAGKDQKSKVTTEGYFEEVRAKH